MLIRQICTRGKINACVQVHVVTVRNPNDLDIWTDWCRLGLQFAVYKVSEQERRSVKESLVH